MKRFGRWSNQLKRSLLWIGGSYPALFMIGLLAFGGTEAEGSRSIVRQFDFRLEPTSELNESGATEFELQFSPKYPCGDWVTVKTLISSYKETFSSDSLEVPLDSENSHTRLLAFEIPASDTSCLYVTLECGRFKSTIGRYFVRTADSIEYWKGNPRDHRPFRWGPGPKTERRGTVIPGEFPEDDSIFGIADTHIVNTPKEVYGQLTKDEMTRMKMRQLEREPLANEPVQSFIVDGQVWSRKKGEYKFHPADPVAEYRERRRRLIDSLLALSSEAMVEVCLFLQDATKVRLAEELFGSLGQPTGTTFYHIKVRKSKIASARSKGIRFEYLAVDPHQHSEATGSSDADSESDGTGSGELNADRRETNSDLFYYETFSSGWEGGWSATDENSSYGFDYWGSSNWKSISIWCAGNGNMVDGGPYDQGMNSNVISDAIDISGYRNRFISWSVWYDIDPNPGFDNMTFSYSYNSYDWFSPFTYTG